MEVRAGKEVDPIEISQMSLKEKREEEKLLCQLISDRTWKSSLAGMMTLWQLQQKEIKDNNCNVSVLTSFFGDHKKVNYKKRFRQILIYRER